MAGEQLSWRTKDLSVNNTDQATPRQPIYEIRLKGHLDHRWFYRFEGMAIDYQANGDTLLTGPVADQSALFGILNHVRSIGIPLLDVKRVLPD